MCKRLPSDKMLALKETFVTFAERKRVAKKQLYNPLQGGYHEQRGRGIRRKIFSSSNYISSLTATSHECIISLGMRLGIE